MPNPIIETRATEQGLIDQDLDQTKKTGLLATDPQVTDPNNNAHSETTPTETPHLGPHLLHQLQPRHRQGL
jgi:hypothetical protein